MKMLDEVIDDLKMKCKLVICNRPKDDYWVVPIETIRDALHYLKEYREQKEQIDALPDYYDLVNFWTEQQANPPLDYETLRTMVGKPVWVEWTVKGVWHHGDWNLVHAQDDQKIWLADGNGEITDVPEELLGKTWQAYRKER